MNAGPSWNKVQHPKNSAGKRQSQPQRPHVSSQLRNSLVSVSQPAEDKLKESVFQDKPPERNLLGPRCQGASGSKLFLDFQSMKIIKEDADEDSASDLSDSERIPIPPSPLTPPDLNLRAEEIDPVYFDLHPGQGHAKPGYHYPDFLPPPFSSWDLRDMALLLNAEGKAEAVPQVAGLLGKYIDRLVQLEWLQIQTIQGEKGKGTKARPPTAPGTLGALKSPGRSKLITSALSKPLPHQEGASKSGPSRKKDFHHEEAHAPYYTLKTAPKPSDLLGSSRLCSQKQTLAMRTEEKKKKSSKSTKLQPWDLSCSDSRSQMETDGNIRTPRQSAVSLDTASSCKGARTQAHANLKKKGNANSCGRAAPSSEKRLRTNGIKQSTYELK
ncbi:protein FAM217B [Otolemur garnettii]|uniref:Family with sequence similarity 217 member B n=1 Tax=Otolemur garnettii TaxID=30611 RepID=H0WQI6_OTOGA|nr:protein FAM217B [Otolemur garnettii]XP_023367776.1 protein FAM217B [Otolemur garnettii]XP_023367777.1 protein FAM217B [Otolemur garnettii]